MLTVCPLLCLSPKVNTPPTLTFFTVVNRHSGSLDVQLSEVKRLSSPIVTSGPEDPGNSSVSVFHGLFVVDITIDGSKKRNHQLGFEVQSNPL